MPASSSAATRVPPQGNPDNMNSGDLQKLKLLDGDNPSMCEEGWTFVTGRKKIPRQRIIPNTTKERVHNGRRSRLTNNPATDRSGAAWKFT